MRPSPSLGGLRGRPVGRRLTAAASAPESPVYRQSINILELEHEHIHINFLCCIFSHPHQLPLLHLLVRISLFCSLRTPYFLLFGGEPSWFKCSSCCWRLWGRTYEPPRIERSSGRNEKSKYVQKKKIHPHPCWILRVSTPCSVLWTRLTVTSTSSRGVAAAVRREPL
jgi:hypothetical protein